MRVIVLFFIDSVKIIVSHDRPSLSLHGLSDSLVIIEDFGYHLKIFITMAVINATIYFKLSEQVIHSGYACIHDSTKLHRRDVLVCSAVYLFYEIVFIVLNISRSVILSSRPVCQKYLCSFAG